MTVNEIREHLRGWIEADKAIMRGKSYTIDGLTYTRQDASTIREQINYWSALLKSAMGRGSVSVRYAAPLDGFFWGRRCR